MLNNNSLITTIDGQESWIHKTGDKYIATGITRDNKRFKLVYSNWYMVDNINLYKGSKWLLRDNKKYLITRV